MSLAIQPSPDLCAHAGSSGVGAGSLVRSRYKGVSGAVSLPTVTASLNLAVGASPKIFWTGQSFIAVFNSTCKRSADDGLNWQNVTGWDTSIYSPRFASDGAGTVVVADNYGRWQVSTDDGLTWTAITKPALYSTAWPIETCPMRLSDRFLITTGGDATTSTDGANWTVPVRPGITFGTMVVAGDLAVSAGFSGTTISTSKNGIDWQTFNLGSTLNATPAMYAPKGRSDLLMVAGTYGIGIKYINLSPVSGSGLSPIVSPQISFVFPTLPSAISVASPPVEHIGQGWWMFKYDYGKIYVTNNFVDFYLWLSGSQISTGTVSASNDRVTIFGNDGGTSWYRVDLRNMQFNKGSLQTITD